MSSVKCYSVRLKSLISISEKCYEATAFNGASDLIPKSQVYGKDHSVGKSDAYWIAAWILEKKNLQHSKKKVAWFDGKTGHQLPSFRVKSHVPDQVPATKRDPHPDLLK